MITTDTLPVVQITVDKLIEQGQKLFADIAETAHDRARLLKEAETREHVIEKLNEDLAQAQARNRDLELRNSRLVDDVMKFESSYNEASALLDSIRATVNPKHISIGNSGNGNGELASLLHRARARTDRPTGQTMKAIDAVQPAGETQ